MLSLKDPTFRLKPAPGNSLLDLPNEILDVIVDYVYIGAGNSTYGIIPISLTCRSLRQSSCRLLFRRVTLVATVEGFRRRSRDVLQGFWQNLHLLEYIQCLQIRKPLRADGAPLLNSDALLALSKTLLECCIPFMTNLREVRIDHLSRITICTLTAITHRPELHVYLELNGFNDEYPPLLPSIVCSTPMPDSWQWSLALPRGMVHSCARTIEVMKSSSKVIAIQASYLRDDRLFQQLIRKKQKLGDLQELQISSQNHELTEHLANHNIVPWENLKRLSVAGKPHIDRLRSSIMSRLVSVEYLRLRSLETTAFHRDCMTPEDEPLFLDGLSLSCMPKLRHMELEGVCTHLPISTLTPRHLYSLRLQTPEAFHRTGGSDTVRPCADMIWLAQNAHDLERLEVHVGDLDNLWHPTAIPGVDVDVSVYQFLHAIAKIPKLRILRLFPRYIPRDAWPDFMMTARQPVSDEQAVRIFQHLRRLRPSLEILSIARSARHFTHSHGFRPMCWVIRDGGNSKTILTTRQEEEDYEIEQVWIGERRMMTRNRRHAYRKPYLEHYGSWAFPPE